MALPEQLESLLDSRAYPHHCQQIELIETHISWVILTGDFAYKLKKPVHFNFVDFSTLAKREHFCHEELRCNRAFAAHLYLDVVPVIGSDPESLSSTGASARVLDKLSSLADDAAHVIEWAVKMRQFDPQQGLDKLLERGQLHGAMLHSFGATLAARHALLPRHEGTSDEVSSRIFGPVEDNFDEIGHTGLAELHRPLLDDALAQSRQLGTRLREKFDERMKGGWIRECHGDLHLSNLAVVGAENGGEVTAFDCLEFNANLRWIDTMSDVAFLFMDCHIRSERGLAYAFLDGYLDASGDYDGACLLHYFAAYRSVVRAKVAALRWVQQADDELAGRCLEHLRWARDWLVRPTGKLILTCGLSGSGKSYLAGLLTTALPAVRLRSDVARKKLAGLTAREQSQSPIDGGLYDSGQSDRTFEYLAEVAEALLLAGENVIVDATFIEHARRLMFFNLAAKLGTKVELLFCTAPLETLRERLEARNDVADDPSEATHAVLELQLKRFETPLPDEHAIELDMTGPVTGQMLTDLSGRINAD